MKLQKKLNIRLKSVHRQLQIQGENGNWNCDPYMHGMYNGLECAIATLEGRDPEYRSAPAKWLKDRTVKPKEGTQPTNPKPKRR